MAVSRTATTSTGTHASRVVMARSRGVLVGTLLVLLGAWGALVPFLGHHWGYGFTPANGAWTHGRGWLEVLPGVAAAVGGLLLIVSGNRLTAMVGGWLAVAAGAWFVVGTIVTPWWNAGSIGTPLGNVHHAVWERLGMFEGLGVAIVFLGAFALGRASIVGARDIAAAENRTATTAEPVDLVAAENRTTATTQPVATNDENDAVETAPSTNTTAPATTSPAATTPAATAPAATTATESTPGAATPATNVENDATVDGSAEPHEASSPVVSPI